MKKNTTIDGIAASEHLDSSGESLSIEGMDISSLGGPDSILNWEHGSKDRPSQVVGKVTFAKKIMKSDDAKTKREKYFWNKVKKPFVYIKAELFDGIGHSGAQDVAAMLRYKNKDKGEDSRLVVGFSIEGGKMEKKGMLVTKSIARDVAITVKPCNKVCDAELLDINGEDEDFLYKNQEFDCEILEKGSINVNTSGYRNLIMSDIKKTQFDLERKTDQENKVAAIKAIRDIKTKEASGKKVPQVGRGVFSEVKDAGNKVVKKLNPQKDKIYGFSDEMVNSDLERQVTNNQYLKDSGIEMDSPGNYVETSKGKYLVQDKIKTLKDAVDAGNVNSKKAKRILDVLRDKLSKKRLKIQDLKEENVSYDPKTKKVKPFDVSMLEVKGRNAMFQPKEGGLHEEVTSNRPDETAMSEAHKQAAKKAKQKYISSSINKSDSEELGKSIYQGMNDPRMKNMKTGDTILHDKKNTSKTTGRTGSDIYNDPKTFENEGPQPPKRPKKPILGIDQNYTPSDWNTDNNMRKALIAGMMGGTPDSKTGMAALTKEDLQGEMQNVSKKKVKKNENLQKGQAPISFTTLTGRKRKPESNVPTLTNPMQAERFQREMGGDVDADAQGMAYVNPKGKRATISTEPSQTREEMQQTKGRGNFPTTKYHEDFHDQINEIDQKYPDMKGHSQSLVRYAIDNFFHPKDKRAMADYLKQNQKYGENVNEEILAHFSDFRTDSDLRNNFNSLYDLGEEGNTQRQSRIKRAMKDIVKWAGSVNPDEMKKIHQQYQEKDKMAKLPLDKQREMVPIQRFKPGESGLKPNKTAAKAVNKKIKR